MNATVATLAIALLLITESLSAPLARNTRSLGFNKFTCLPKQGSTYSKNVPTALQCLVHDMLVSVVVAYGWEFFGRISNPS